MKNLFIVFAGVLFGMYFTFFCVDYGWLSPVLASALAGLIGSLAFVKRFNIPHILGLAVYCGSFAGMGNILSAFELFLTAVIATTLIVISTRVFKGFGGKLGLIAYTASLLSETLILLVGSHKIDGFSLLEVFGQFNPTLDFTIMLTVLISSASGFYLTVFFHHNLNKSPVFSSAFPSFIVGLLFFTELPFAPIIATTFFSASFVGMVAEDILPKKHFPTLIAVHVLTILLFKNNFGSYGGALGTMAFLAVFLIIQLDLVFNKFTIKKQKAMMLKAENNELS